MRKKFRLRLEKVNPKKLMLFNRISITVSGILLFLIWLVFLTNNFYPKANDNLAAIIMNWPLQLSIWPITLFILFIVIMPIWVTNNFELLVVFLFLSLFFLFLNFLFLVFLNISKLWVLWLVIDIIVFFNIIFILFSIYYLNEKNVKKY